MGEFLALLRKTNGFTQQDVADKLNISNRTLSSWETDRTTPDILLLPSIADLYGVTVDELLRCERQPEQIETNEEPPKRDIDESYVKFNRTRIKLTAIGILCALVVLAGCITMLFSPAPLWVDVLLICAGVIMNIVFIVLIFKQENLAKQDYDGDKKAYALALRHKTSLSIIINSLIYFAEIAIILLCYCNTSVYPDEDVLGRVSEYYETYTAIAVSICAAMGLALFLTGILNKALYVNCLGNAQQKNTSTRNIKLLKKISLFGIIPVALSLIPFAVFTHVHIAEPEEPYFTANGVEEVYKNFQTLIVSTPYANYDADNDDLTIIPKGEYYLNFQSETYVEGFCSITNVMRDIVRYYDLGSGFYADYGYSDGKVCSASLYYLKNGIKVDDIDPLTTDLSDCFFYYGDVHTKIIYFTAPDGTELFAGCVKYYYERGDVYYGYLYNFYDELNLTRDGDVYTYQLTNYYDYSPLLTYIFAWATAATVLVCGGLFLIKCKKIRYTF